MKRYARILSALTLALSCDLAMGQDVTPTQEPVVVAQDLQKLRAAGNFAAVLWTRRTTLCTLQVVTARSEGGSRVVRAEAPEPGVKSQPLKIEVWLLKADGTNIPSTGRRESQSFNNNPRLTRGPASEVLFSFPLSASKDAASVVMTVNGKTYIEPLQPFKDQAH